MSTSSALRNSWRTSGRTLRYSASSSVYFTGIVSGRATTRLVLSKSLHCCCPHGEEILAARPKLALGFSGGFFREAVADAVAEGFAVEARAGGFYHGAHLL